ncbi:bile acid:sodium symporter family protein [Mycobacterium simiae]|uniref:bile acid:sodium symporter family protein n=1 Tax=Mycobacterium simiae TaxID=1784 RepID=UPI0003FE8166|nr:bile acid:sodium symporter family protein [Mycobacterium simiae]BBX41000.1 putative Na+-dependent transporter [Mycobacterium simiae]
MRARLSPLLAPLLDPLLIGLAITVVLAALLPARGAAGHAASIAAEVAIALLFFLYGLRLSPQQAWHGVRQWRLHLLVLAATFVLFPLLGLAARALVPSVLTLDLYRGVLFLCLVPSTLQSSVAFTSIARGHVSAAIVSASLSNLLGIVLTPLLVVLLMNTGGAIRVDGGALRDIVVQLLLPFGAGQLARPWIAELLIRYGAVVKVVDRASILLVVYAAFSMGVVEGLWSSVDPWRLVLVFLVTLMLLAVVLAATAAIGRLTRLDRGDAVVLLFCGSKKSLASGLPIALVFFPAATVGLTMLPLMIYHQVQLVVCAVIASRLGRKADEQSAVGEEVNSG